MAIIKGIMFQLVSSSASLIGLDPVNSDMKVFSRQPMVANNTTSLQNVITTNDLAYIIHGRTTTPFITIIDTATEQNVTPYTSNPGAQCISLAINPAGTKIACGLTGGNFIIYYDYPGFAWSIGPNPAATVNHLEFSPDGTKLACALNASPWIKIYDVASGSDVTPTWGVTPSVSMQAISWSPDGTQIAFGGTTVTAGQVRWFNATTGALVGATGLSTSTRDIAWSPDGTKIAIATNATGNNGVRFFNTSTGAEVVRTKPTNCQDAGRSVRWLSNDIIAVVGDIGAYVYEYSTQTALANVVSQFTTVNGGGFPFGIVAKKIAGTVVDAALNPVARKVRVFDRKTGIRLGETTSNAGTGAFSVVIFSPDAVDVIAQGGSGENCRVFGPVTPVNP